MHVVIVANGSGQDREFPKYNYLIAVDNGATYCLKKEIKPNLVIGDFDSLPVKTFEYLQSLSVPFKKYPVEKDQTDLEIALLFAVNELSAKKITLINAVGGRDDLTLANIFLLAHPRLIDAKITLIGEEQNLTLITPLKPFSQKLNVATKLSLLPISPQVDNVLTQGLKYPLNHEALHFAYSRSLSNEVIAPQVDISISSGLLIVCY